MALLTLYFETISKQLAAGINLPLGMRLPTFRQEDILSLEISVITQINQFTAPLYALAALAGWSCRVAIGTPASVLAQQNVFPLDVTGKKFVGALNLNTAGINALADRQPNVFCEVLVTDPLGGVYGKRFECFIEKAIYTSGAVVVPPGDVALTELKAARTYIPQQGPPGGSFILTSANGTKQGIVYWHDDGSFRAESIS